MCYCKSIGYEVVFLGKKHTETGVEHNITGYLNDQIDFSAGINLMDKTSLLEATKIIAGAKFLIGLDSGICHLGGCTDTPLIVGFTNVEPKYRLPYRYNSQEYKTYPVVPPESLACRFCQSNFCFTYSHDFKTCYYQDYNCIKQLTPALYIEQIERCLNE